jgi:hypothetical protein
MTRLADERGLIGKILVLWLLVAALVVVLVIDLGTVVLARLHVSDLARDAATVGADTYGETGRRRPSVQATRTALAEADADAHLDAFDIDEEGTVSVTVSDPVGTLLAGRIGLFETVSASDSESPDR